MTKLFVIQSDAETWEEAIQKTSAVLLENHCVTDDFCISCIEREKMYPTGLTDYCPVALPHTSKEHVIHQAICALKLNKPVKFYSMEDTNKTIEVSVVLNLAFLDDSQHIQIISRIIRSLKEENFIKKLTQSSVEELEELINIRILN